jgi:lysophospholipase L1-like esterase
MTIDGIHLNGTGYLAWAKALREHLEQNDSNAVLQD